VMNARGSIYGPRDVSPDTRLRLQALGYLEPDQDESSGRSRN